MITCNPITESRRQAYIETLYLLDGRNNPDHPHHATFTGLLKHRLQQLIAADMDLLLSGSDEGGQDS